MSTRSLRGRTVVVTGASAGLGRAIVRELAREGARIGLIARGRDGLEATRREVEELGGAALVLPLDVADAGAVELAAGRVEADLGPIDVWINNAMVSVFSPVGRMQAEEYRRVTEVTYLGYVYGTLSALRRMRERNAGTIVQVGSALAYQAIPLQSAYCAAKHAVQGFTESLRTELRHDQSRVRVVMVQMPALNTPQFDWVRSKLPGRAQPVPPIFQPEVGARAVLHAVRSGRAELWVGWPTVKAIVGSRAVSAYMERYLAAHAYDAQQTSRPGPDRPDNLFDPVAGDHGAHGRFDARSKRWSVQAWLSMHRRAVVIGAGAAVAAAWLGRRSIPHRSERQRGRRWPLVIARDR